MTVLNIFKLEDVNQTKAVSKLQHGEHPIGRDGILKCIDKRVSRRHAILKITDDTVTLKSIHVNPCFYKAAKGNCIVLVKKDESVTLSDGDQFALLADSYWFKVRLSSDEVAHESPETQALEEFETPSKANTTEENKVKEPQNVSCLRNISLLLNTSLHAEEAKIDSSLLMSNLENIVEQDFGTTAIHICAEEELNDSVDFSALFTKEVEEANEEGGSGLVVESAKEEKEIDQPKKEEVSSDSAEESEKASNEVKESTPVDLDSTKAHGNSGDETSKPEEPSVSTDKPKVRRDRCWYGASCYRKNPAHRAAISHPGDDDYDSDPTDDRPVCPFGTACYRTNVDHRRVYKHSAPPSTRKPAPVPQPKQSPKKQSDNSSDSEPSDKDVAKDTGKRRKRKAAQKVKFNETPEDDYDYDDPFLNDASSDDFELSEDDSDTTDWEDSQCVDEESQERKRLLKEAKKFTKGKKRKKT